MWDNYLVASFCDTTLQHQPDSNMEGDRHVNNSLTYTTIVIMDSHLI